MRKIDLLLNEYGESHQNETNKLVHWFAVPIIVWCVLALLWSIPAPAFITALSLNWASLVMILSVIFYITLSWQLAIGMAVFSLISFALISFYVGATQFALWKFALIVFVVAWMAQFWGHKIEGKKPSFFKDVVFLMVGPAWLLSFLYNKMGVKY
jgi:uncharacterized membrane protein YGL010W